MKNKKNNLVITILFFIVMIVVFIFGFNSCRKRTVPDDFNIAFQFGTNDKNMITFDSYNGYVTKGAAQEIREAFVLSPEDREAIYNKLQNLNIKGFNGDYYGSSSSENDISRFSIKFTMNKKTNIISGNGTTISYSKKDTKKLVEFKDYLIAFTKELPEYRKVVTK